MNDYKNDMQSLFEASRKPKASDEVTVIEDGRLKRVNLNERQGTLYAVYNSSGGLVGAVAKSEAANPDYWGLRGQRWALVELTGVPSDLESELLAQGAKPGHEGDSVMASKAAPYVSHVIAMGDGFNPHIIPGYRNPTRMGEACKPGHKGKKRKKKMPMREQVEASLGFSIMVEPYDEDFRGRYIDELPDAMQDQIYDDALTVEKNVLIWLKKYLEAARPEGHDSSGELIGTCYMQIGNVKQEALIKAGALWDNSDDPLEFGGFGDNDLSDYLDEKEAYRGTVSGWNFRVGLSFFNLDEVRYLEESTRTVTEAYKSLEELMQSGIIMLQKSKPQLVTSAVRDIRKIITGRIEAETGMRRVQLVGTFELDFSRPGVDAIVSNDAQLIALDRPVADLMIRATGEYDNDNDTFAFDRVQAMLKPGTRVSFESADSNALLQVPEISQKIKDFNKGKDDPWMLGEWIKAYVRRLPETDATAGLKRIVEVVSSKELAENAAGVAGRK